jgi:hypothetical protein
LASETERFVLRQQFLDEGDSVRDGACKLRRVHLENPARVMDEGVGKKR